MGIRHSQRLTAAAAVALPQRNMYLVEVQILGGATPGSLSFNYDGTNTAIFGAPSNGTDSQVSYKVNHQIKGTNIPAASFTWNGGIAAAMLIFDTESGDGPPIESYRAVRVARTDAGAVTANVTFTYNGGQSKPLAIVTYISASAGRVTFPATGGFQLTVESYRSRFPGIPTKCPDLEEANTLVVSLISDGASTSESILYY